ncbi:hypothetical protein O181_035776 [Austropuccinia psidii MF-1]|uniref:Uncharacterized protein n=1 Tax=Austropuccinia psidii MF-1 TaxID=1389203 RepID=A0A9Q3H999_9BASI|nr:hypothetical protein [Austropuccinia psidii MF-1]
MSPEKIKDLLKGWRPISCKGQVQNIKAWLKAQRISPEEQKQEMAQKKDKSPVKAPQASPSKNLPQKVPKKGKKAPKTNQKGKKKAKSKWNKPYPQDYGISNKEKTSMDNVFDMAKALIELKTRRKKE